MASTWQLLMDVMAVAQSRRLEPSSGAKFTEALVAGGWKPGPGPWAWATRRVGGRRHLLAAGMCGGRWRQAGRSDRRLWLSAGGPGGAHTHAGAQALVAPRAAWTTVRTCPASCALARLINRTGMCRLALPPPCTPRLAVGQPCIRAPTLHGRAPAHPHPPLPSRRPAAPGEGPCSLHTRAGEQAPRARAARRQPGAAARRAGVPGGQVPRQGRAGLPAAGRP
jgi:hypothetical protein